MGAGSNLTSVVAGRQEVKRNSRPSRASSTARTVISAPTGLAALWSSASLGTHGGQSVLQAGLGQGRRRVLHHRGNRWGRQHLHAAAAHGGGQLSRTYGEFLISSFCFIVKCAPFRYNKYTDSRSRRTAVYGIVTKRSNRQGNEIPLRVFTQEGLRPDWEIPCDKQEVYFHYSTQGYRLQILCRMAGEENMAAI